MHAGVLSGSVLRKPMAGADSRPVDGRSINDLVRAHFESVWRALRRFGLSPADADDAAQQVCLVLARRLAEIEPGRERAFMFGAALKVASRLRRSQSRRREIADPEFEAMHSLQPGPEAVLDQRRAAELLDRVLDGLDDDLRATFVLHEIEHLTMAEVAELLAIPAGTVASRLRRAREQFNRRLAALRGAKRADLERL
jgi:RNA polymerase sigma-70 factor, ECF subfamily